MNPFPRLAGPAVLLLVAGFGFGIWKMAAAFSDASSATPPPPEASTTKPRPAAAAPQSPAEIASADRHSRSAKSPAGEDLRDFPNPASAPNDGRDAAQKRRDALSEADLQRRAALVEQEANHDLQHLVGLLDLTEDQQDRIFAKLARRSPEWHPSMQFGSGDATTSAGGVNPSAASNFDGTSAYAAAALAGIPLARAGGDAAAAVLPPTPANTATASPAKETPAVGTLTGSGSLSLAGAPDTSTEVPLLDAIAADLTPEQQQELATAELDRVAWWEEIITKLLPDSGVPALGTTPSNGTAATAPSSGTGTSTPSPDAVKSAEPDLVLD